MQWQHKCVGSQRLVGVTSLLFFCELKGVNKDFKQLSLPSELFHCPQRTFFFNFFSIIFIFNDFYFIYVYGGLPA